MLAVEKALGLVAYEMLTERPRDKSGQMPSFVLLTNANTEPLSPALEMQYWTRALMSSECTAILILPYRKLFRWLVHLLPPLYELLKRHLWPKTYA